MNKPTLAERRAALLDRCAEQRAVLADDVQSLRPSNLLGHPVAGYLVGHKKLMAGALGAGLGLMLVRRKRLLAIAGSAMSAWRMAQGGLAMLGQLRR